MTTEQLVHVGSEAAWIIGAKPDIFVKVETDPATPQLLKTRRRPLAETLNKRCIEGLHGASGGHAERFQTVLIHRCDQMADEVINDRLHQCGRFSSALNRNREGELEHAVSVGSTHQGWLRRGPECHGGVVGGSIAPDLRPPVEVAKNLAEVGPLEGQPMGSPLTHSHSVAVALTLGFEHDPTGSGAARHGLTIDWP